ncbi:MAG TPA: TatD family hydrolase, partial [Flavisolibacter sp.]
MYLIDSHTHVYLPEFADDRKVVVERAREQGVELMFLPAIDSSTHDVMMEVERLFPQCRAMMGLHPCSVKPDYNRELDIIKDHLSKRNFIAIGEIGLDFYWDKTHVKQQFEAFHQQIELALSHALPIVIHSRNAVDECIEVVSGYPGLKGVFHCFSGNVDQARKILDLDFLLGIGGVVTFKNSGLDKVIEITGIDRVI